MRSLTERLAAMPEEDRLQALRHLPELTLSAGERLRTQALLGNCEFLEAKAQALPNGEGVSGLLEDFARAEAAGIDPDRRLSALATAIRLSANTLANDPRQTFSQIYGRLLDNALPPLRTLLDTYAPAHPWFRLRTATLISSESPSVRALSGHTDEVTSCVFSDDATIALSASKDGTVRVWDVGTGVCTHVLQGHQGEVNCCALSADGSIALSGSSDQTLRLWDTSTGRLLDLFEGHTGKVTGCDIDAEGVTCISSSNDQTVRIWRRQSRTSLALQGHEERVTCCALSRDGTLALSGSYDGTLRLWNATTGACLAVLESKFGGITHCALSHDGSLALYSSVAYLIDEENYDAATELLPVTVFYKGGAREEAEDIPQEDASQGSHDTDRPIEENLLPLLAQALQDAGITAEALQEEGVVYIWDLATGDDEKTLTGLEVAVTDLGLSADAKRAIACSGGTGVIKVWELERRTCLATFLETTAGVPSCALDTHGDLALSASHAGDIRIWDVRQAIGSASPIPARDSTVNPIVGCSYDRASDLIITASLIDTTIRWWSGASGNLIAQVKVAGVIGIEEFAVSSLGKVGLIVPPLISLLTEVFLVNAQTGELLGALKGHTSGVACCAIDAQGKRGISGAYDGSCYLWDLDQQVSTFQLEGHTAGVACCAMSDDGTIAVTGSEDGILRIWDVATGQCRHLLSQQTLEVAGCALSADGTRVLSASDDQTIRWWDVQAGVLLGTHHAPSPLIGQCAVSPDGKWAAYCARQGTAPSIHVLALEGERTETAFTFDANITSVTFLATHQSIAAADVSGHVHVLDLILP